MTVQMNSPYSDEICLSVRSFVEWILRSGDIDSRSEAGLSENAMAIGSLVHKRLQQREKAEGLYEAEVALKISASLLDGEKEVGKLCIEGRADGIYEPTEENPLYVIDEIKSTFSDVSLMEEPVPVHFAQAAVYAYIYATDNRLPAIGIQMRYVTLETEDGKMRISDTPVRTFYSEYSYEEISALFNSYLEKYKPWALWVLKHRRERMESINNLSFPFSYRSGQKKLVYQVYDTIGKEEMLFVEAPTGTGKTIAMLYPSIRRMGEGLTEKIFYLTAKTVTSFVAEDTMKLLFQQGLKATYVKITAKEKMCPLKTPECDPIHCPYAKGHFDRVNDCIYELITTKNSFSMSEISEAAERYKVCPFEMSLDASYFADVIIGDYNYAFAPHVALKRYFEGGSSDAVLLIDEAHNLSDRAREMYSAILVKENILSIKHLFSDAKSIVTAAEKVNKILLELKRECDKVTLFTEETFPTVLIYALLTLRDKIGKYLEETKNPENRADKLTRFFEIRDFLDTYDVMGEDYISYASFTESGEFFLKLFCIHPARRLGETFSDVRSSILFSATFLPIRYYKELLSEDPEVKAIQTESPFPPDHKKIVIASDVTSRYQRRNEDEYRKIASYITKIASEKRGNYLVFFPSYKFMEEVRGYISEDAGTILMQKRTMTEEDRREFLKTFETTSDTSLLGLTVIGGLFSEGIDLTGEKLIGVIIVGTGFPMVDAERELMKQYYEAHEENGFDFAYRFPGFNKVLQCAGRLIRTAEDRGMIFLLDDRFLQYPYPKLFPSDWKIAVTNIDGIESEIRDFWGKQIN